MHCGCSPLCTHTLKMAMKTTESWPDDPSALGYLVSFPFILTSVRSMLLRFLLFCRWGNTTWERLNDSPKCTRAVELLCRSQTLLARVQMQRIHSYSRDFPALTPSPLLLLSTHCIRSAKRACHYLGWTYFSASAAVSYGQCSGGRVVTSPGWFFMLFPLSRTLDGDIQDKSGILE